MRHPFRKPSVIISLILLAACVVFWHRGNRQRESIGYRSGTASSYDAWGALTIMNGNLELIMEGSGSAHRLTWISLNDDNDVDAHDPGVVPPSPGFCAWTRRDVTTRTSVWEHGPLGTNGVHSLEWRDWRLLYASRLVIMQVPIWAVMSIISVPLILASTRFLRLRRRERQGLCLGCGYDLRATKNRCPECGTEIPASDENSPKIETPVAS